uniref:DUF229 domain-containing protein n=1 Tax=Glossina austeni TaxID=7395 RepID=A0A1A9UXB8_GLOAU
MSLNDEERSGGSQLNLIFLVASLFQIHADSIMPFGISKRQTSRKRDCLSSHLKIARPNAIQKRGTNLKAGEYTNEYEYIWYRKEETGSNGLPVALSPNQCTASVISGLSYYLWKKSAKVTIVDPVDIKSKSYFVDTPGCRLLALNVMNDQLRKYVKQLKEPDCGTPLLRISKTGSQLWVNVDKKGLLKMYNVPKLEDIECLYHIFERITDFRNVILDTVAFKLSYRKPVKLKKHFDLLRVECRHENLLIYTDCFYILNRTKLSESTKGEDAKTNRLSVMILGIDALSHVNFLRQMPKTAEFIKQNLSHVEFFGYNKVDENTFPNLIPLLTGLKTKQLSEFCNISREMDDCPIIWKRFKEAGYKTAYGEDLQHLTLFQYNRAGFEKQPTDFYFRTFALEMSKLKWGRDRNTYACYGKRAPLEMLLDYIRNLVPFMQYNDFFSLFWSISLSHDDLNTPQFLDKPFLNLLKLFDSTKILNKTAIFLMSDHGLRLGNFRLTHQGEMEDMEPLLITLLPKWFESKYPEAIKNMRINANRLTTHFDVYATMLDLIDLEYISDVSIQNRIIELTKKSRMPRSISLFLPISDRRTCFLADIPDTYCGCFDRISIPINASMVEFAAKFIVDEINQILEPHLTKCAKLELHLIRHASFMSNAMRFKKYHPFRLQDVFVQLQTVPGYGIFEATVRSTAGRSTLSDNITRINRYENQIIQTFSLNQRKGFELKEKKI